MDHEDDPAFVEIILLKLLKKLFPIRKGAWTVYKKCVPYIYMRLYFKLVLAHSLVILYLLYLLMQAVGGGAVLFGNKSSI